MMEVKVGCLKEHFDSTLAFYYSCADRRARSRPLFSDLQLWSPAVLQTLELQGCLRPFHLKSRWYSFTTSSKNTFYTTLCILSNFINSEKLKKTIGQKKNFIIQSLDERAYSVSSKYPISYCIHLVSMCRQK